MTGSQIDIIHTNVLTEPLRSCVLRNNEGYMKAEVTMLVLGLRRLCWFAGSREVLTLGKRR